MIGNALPSQYDNGREHQTHSENEPTFRIPQPTSGIPILIHGIPQSTYGTSQPSYGIRQPPISAPQPLSWFSESKKNAPQGRSLTAASCIFLSGGMSLAYTLDFFNILEPFSHRQICWFIAVMLGTCISTFLVKIIKNRFLNITASVLVTINGIIILTAEPYSSILTFGRYCDGIAFGLTLIPTLIAGSEQSVKRFRGLNLSVEQVSISSGFLVFLASQNLSDFDLYIPKTIVGILTIILGLGAFFSALFLTIETSIFYLIRNNETEALNVLIRLQTPKAITNETHAFLDENKQLLAEDTARGRTKNISLSFLPLLKVILLRIIVGMSLSFPILSSTSVYIQGVSPMFYLFALMRFLGSLISSFTLDIAGRRISSSAPMFFGGLLLILNGWTFTSDSIFNTSSSNFVLLLCYQLTAGVVAPASTCYLGEAFPISLKPYLILFSIVIENLIQIGLCSKIFLENGGIFNIVSYSFGAIQIVSSVILFLTLPETKQTTLREALLKFKIGPAKF